MKLLGYVDLPENRGDDGFDHAAVSVTTSRLFVAHTANDAIDIIDCETDRYAGSVEGLPGVAGALVSDRRGLWFTSNRGEDRVGISQLSSIHDVRKVPVGARPNGLSYDPGRNILYAANVGESPTSGKYTVTVVDVNRGTAIHEIEMPGRTRWTIFDEREDRVFVNIREPACLAVIDGANPDHVERLIEVAGTGPHGLELDPYSGRLFCACDDGTLHSLDSRSGRAFARLSLSGAPDVIFLDVVLRRLFVASGKPGMIDVVDIDDWRLVQSVATEAGAHTIGFDPSRHKVYAFLPQSHRAAVFAVA